MMIESVAVRCHTRHEHVALQIGTRRFGRGLNVPGGGATVPVVHVIENNVYFFANERRLDLAAELSTNP